jgi:calcineurin-like phosphoesterase family protein
MHDGFDRLQTFIQSMQRKKVDALLQLGDFAYPSEKNKAVIDLFNQAHPVRMHVIGNHDTDAGYTKQQCIQYWGMPNRYYRQDVEGIRLLVLDANDKGSPTYKGGYPSFIQADQVRWLKQELETTDRPVLIVSHQPLAGELAIDNAAELQQLLAAHKDKVLLAINGHSHIDALYTMDDVRYVHINSASYYWVGGTFKHDSYAQDVMKKYEWIQYTCPYKDSLFATLRIDPKAGNIRIEGQSSTWVGPTPKELGMPETATLRHEKEITAKVSSRNLTGA